MNSKPNADIRTAIRESNLCQYQVADWRFGIYLHPMDEK